MVEETENLVLVLLREMRKEQTEQCSVLLGVVDQMRRMDNDMRGLRDDMRGMEQRLEARILAVRDDLEFNAEKRVAGAADAFQNFGRREAGAAVGSHLGP